MEGGQNSLAGCVTDSWLKARWVTRISEISLHS
jgi:hypothetical protein